MRYAALTVALVYIVFICWFCNRMYFLFSLLLPATFLEQVRARCGTSWISLRCICTWVGLLPNSWVMCKSSISSPRGECSCQYTAARFIRTCISTFLPVSALLLKTLSNPVMPSLCRCIRQISLSGLHPRFCIPIAICIDFPVLRRAAYHACQCRNGHCQVYHHFLLL